MRLVTYLPPDGPQTGTSFRLDPHGRAGGLVDGPDGTVQIIDLQAAAALVGAWLPPRLLDLVAAGREVWHLAQDLLEAAAGGVVAGRPADELGPALDEVRLLAPIPAPPMVRDFYAFEEHVRAGFARRGGDIPEEWYAFPANYKSNHRAIIGPGEVIPWPSFTEELDYELEIAAVVGIGGRDLDEATAHHHLFGFTILNDVSARDLQRREMAVRLGPAKSKDFATVLGPVLVTTDEVDVTDLRATATIDGETVTDTTTADMHWSFAQMLAWASRDEDVFPGNVLGSGTVAGGCGLEHGRMLQPGEAIALHVAGIGTLANVVGHPRPGSEGRVDG